MGVYSCWEQQISMEYVAESEPACTFVCVCVCEFEPILKGILHTAQGYV